MTAAPSPSPGDSTIGNPGATAEAVTRGLAATVFPVPRTARLEPGPQTGYRFATSGAIVTKRRLRVVNAPLSVTVDRRRAVPTPAGLFLRVTTGDLAGYEVLESPVAYLTGSTTYPTPVSVVDRLVIDRVCVTVHPTGATALTPEGPRS